jgi:hypothetical protein
MGHDSSAGSSLLSCMSAVLLAFQTVGCAQPSAEDGEHLQPTLTALNGPLVPIDSASPLPVTLSWTAEQNGNAPVKALEFEIENRTDSATDVELNIDCHAGSRAGKAAPQHVSVQAHSKLTQSVAIDSLPLQLVGASASTLITAVYKTPEGETRAAALPSLWIEHSADFASATVRSSEFEARANAARGLANLRARKPTAGRALDAMASHVVPISIPNDGSLNTSMLVEQPSWLPDPVKFRAMTPANPEPPPADGIPDSDRKASPSVGAAASDKGGNFVICFKWPYWYYDSLLGEDVLIGQTTSAEGYEPARYMLAVLADSANNWIWSGNLDSTGCTPAVNHPNGAYTGFVTSSLYRPSSDVRIDVTQTDAKTFPWGALPYNISTSGGTITLTLTGAWAVTDAAIAAAQTIWRSTSAYPNGTYTDVFTDQDCPGIPGSGCSSSTQIWLGTNLHGLANAGFKVITEHELGHRVQGALVGIPKNDYTIDATQASCRCDHVTSSNQQHCLQGRAMVSAAQVEGWGQFFAATNLNNGSDSNCTLAYYKEFRNDNGTVTNPPMAKSCYAQQRWMANHCASSSRGTEWDWMNHYWRVSNKDGYSFSDFKSLYTAACGGGSCSGKDVSWFATSAAAVAAFGNNSPKANAWSTQSNNYGVNF